MLKVHPRLKDESLGHWGGQLSLDESWMWLNFQPPIPLQRDHFPFSSRPSWWLARALITQLLGARDY